MVLPRAAKGCNHLIDQTVTILGIESSCDDTAAAIVRGIPSVGGGEILSNVVAGQEALHAPFGGVVPEIAARACQQGVSRSAVTRRKYAPINSGA